MNTLSQIQLEPIDQGLIDKTLGTGYFENQYSLVSNPSVLQNELLKKNLDLVDMKFKDGYMDSWQNQWLKPGLQIMGGLATLGNLWLGFKSYGIAKKQLSLAQDQWKTSKDEYERIKKNRQKLAQSLMGVKVNE